MSGWKDGASKGEELEENRLTINPILQESWLRFAQFDSNRVVEDVIVGWPLPSGTLCGSHTWPHIVRHGRRYLHPAETPLQET
ncbi:hypothetical protein K0M31_000400 [Melipona bicolor]|uniref:Uncharacterized protein n=1 Tax=Melipona bicolor TaxID=60889 RepID=A0AA40KWT4_9HYME|nr:hypothetical protein K0M31_000400 [Melipona bicolor]